MNKKVVAIIIVLLFIGIISLEFIFLGGLDALIDIFQGIRSITIRFIEWIEVLF
ncbi:MAG: hypothetical protein ACFFG0_15385 [Candidatus Thorarchaeota archaeon]